MTDVVFDSNATQHVSPYEYAFFAHLVYKNPDFKKDSSGYDLSKLPDWKVVSVYSSDTSDKYYGAAFKKGDSIVIAHKGTSNFHDIEADINLALDSLSLKDSLDFLDDYVASASGFILDIAKQYPTSTITFTGHSLGGSLAEICAAKFATSAVVFDSPGAASYIKINDFTPSDVTAYQTSPHAINTLDTSSIKTIYRIYPPHNDGSKTQVLIEKIIDFFNAHVAELVPNTAYEFMNYVANQHHMHSILQQFDAVTGKSLISSEQTACWQHFSQNGGYAGFYLRSDLNNYYWARYEPALSHDALQDSHEWFAAEDSVHEKCHFIIIGSDDHDDMIWGAGNYDDVLDGKGGNDHYWAFAGNDQIHDISGHDAYHFFTHNMHGIVTIDDKDGRGEILLDNYISHNALCSIKTMNIVKVENSSFFAFYPFDKKLGCQLMDDFSSQEFALSHDYLAGTEIFFIQQIEDDLQIHLNNNDPTHYSSGGAIIIKNFKPGDLGISLTNSNIDRYYIGGEKDNVLTCNANHNSYLFGLAASDRFINFSDNPYNCTMVGSKYGPKTYVIVPGNGWGSGGITTINGYKADDLLDLSALKLSTVKMTHNINETIMIIPNGGMIVLPLLHNSLNYTLNGYSNMTIASIEDEISFADKIMSYLNPTAVAAAAITITVTLLITRYCKQAPFDDTFNGDVVPLEEAMHSDLIPSE